MKHLLVTVVLLCLLIGTNFASGVVEEDKKPDLITVSGTGTVKALPDRCEIAFSVVTKNPDVKAAQRENARKMEMVMNVLRNPSKGNLNASEIGTSSYSVSEVYYPDDVLKAKFGEKVTIYEVSNTISVETPQIDRVGDIIDYAVTNGANSVSSLDFTASRQKRSELRTQALEIAVDKAHQDALTVLSAMGKALGDVYEVNVQESDYTPYYVNQDIRSTEMQAASPSTPIEPGSIEVSAKVSISYRIG